MYIGMLVVLLESGVDLASSDARGRGALHLAAAAGHTLTALALLRRGGSVAAPDGHGTSAVHAALLAGHATTALALLRAAPPDDALRLLGKEMAGEREETGTGKAGRRGGEGVHALE